MTKCGFLKGMAAGLVVGVGAELVINSKAMRKTELGKAMHKVSTAMDDMIGDVGRAIR